MRRLTPVAIVGALVLCAPAAATLPKPPLVRGSVLGGQTPIRASASITPPVQLFGNTATAHVVVVADRRWVDPSRVRLVVHFTPYEAAGQATERESTHGRFVQMKWTWTLRCLTATCVPVVPPSNLAHIFRLRPVIVHVLGPAGKTQYAVRTRFPATEILSEISPGIVAAVRASKGIPWQYQLVPPPPSYRIPPNVAVWACAVLAFLLGGAGLAILVRWAARLRSPVETASPGPAASSLERALTLFFWAGHRGDETLQRKALERVAAELPFDVANLSEATRELAWSPESPEENEVEAISERAGVPAHHGDGGRA